MQPPPHNQQYQQYPYGPGYQATLYAPVPAGEEFTPYADVGQRFVAWLLDGFLWLVLTSTVTGVIATIIGNTDNTAESDAVVPFIFLCGIVAYYLFPTAFTGRTLGKLICGLRTVRESDLTRAPGIGYGLIRFFTFNIMFFVPFGVLASLTMASNDNPQRRAVHDHAARTRVIDTKKLAQFQALQQNLTPGAPTNISAPAHGFYVPAAPKSHRTLFVLLGLLGAMVVGFVALVVVAIVSDNEYHQVAKDDAERVAAAEDTFITTSGGYWQGTIPAGTVRTIGATTITPSEGNSITVQLVAEGGYCIRVDDTDDLYHDVHYYSSTTREHTHTPCPGTLLPATGSSTIPNLPGTTPPAPEPSTPTENDPAGASAPVGSCWASSDETNSDETNSDETNSEGLRLLDEVPCNSAKAQYVARTQVDDPANCSGDYLDNGYMPNPRRRAYLCLTPLPGAPATELDTQTA